MARTDPSKRRLARRKTPPPLSGSPSPPVLPEKRWPSSILSSLLVILPLAGLVLGSWTPWRLDDLPGIAENAVFRWGTPSDVLTASGPGRALNHLSLALQVHLHGVGSPRPFQMVNALLMGLLAVGFSLLVVDRLPSGPLSHRRSLLALIALFLAHPLAVLPVVYVLQRGTILACLGAVVAVLAAERALTCPQPRGQRTWGGLSLLALILAGTSRETGGVLAGSLLASRWFFLGSPLWRKSGISGVGISFGMMGFLLIAGLLLLGAVFAGGQGGTALQERLSRGLPVDFWRVQTASLWRYARLIFLPFTGGQAISHAAFDPGRAWPLLLLPALGGVGLALRLRASQPLLAFVGGWFLLSLLPHLLVPGASVVEYKALPAVVCFAVAAVWGIQKWTRGPRTASLALLIVWGSAFLPQTLYLQSFPTDEAMWARALKGDPRNPEALLGMGTALIREGHVREGEAAIHAALQVDEERRQRGDFEPAPVTHVALVHAGKAAALRGDGEGAIKAWQAALAIDPGYGEARFNLGLGWIAQERAHEGFREISRAFAEDRSEGGRQERFFALLGAQPELGQAFLRWLKEEESSELTAIFQQEPSLRARVGHLLGLNNTSSPPSPDSPPP